MTPTADIVAQLSLLEKAALLSGANTWQTREIPRLGVPAIWMADGPHGIRKQLGSADHLGIHGSEPATCFPTAATLANSWDESLAAEVGSALGREASAQGVHVLLGPGLNIKRSPLGGRDFEYFSEDPELSGRLAAAMIRGIQSEGVAATPKHFAVNSQELRRMVSDSIIDERTLREIYLTAFEIVVREANPWALMSSYNRVNGVYAHEHEHLLREILREEWGFAGAVISDWGGGNDIAESVRAGGTLEMPSSGFASTREIIAAVRDGRLSEGDVDAGVGELLDLVARDTARAVTAAVDTDAHHDLARRAAGESAVLLKNENRILPLAPGTRVALIGELAETPRYQGSGSSEVNPTRLATLRGSVAQTRLALAGYARGYRRDGSADRALAAEAAELARTADVAVLALGLPEIDESEGLDRSRLSLRAAQVELLRTVARANPNTVVVLSGGGAVETPWLGEARALLHAYLGGQAGAEAVWDVLTGGVNPSGRLAETLPVSLGDVATAGVFPSAGRTAEYREGVFVGYRWFDTAGLDVAFGFGFGLSYTSFDYSGLVLDDDGAAFTVTNTGEVPGAEVAQLYVGRLGSSAYDRPLRELKGFTKVRLEPGESREIRIPFGERTFRVFDRDADAWGVEAGDYEVAVGPHSRHLPLASRISRTGTLARGDGYPARTARVADDEAFAAMLGRRIPSADWPAGPLGRNDSIDRIRDARSPLARAVFGILDRRRHRAEDSGTPDLNILFVFNGPFRIISKMSGGLATGRVTDAVLTLVNGQHLRGIGRLVTAFVAGRRDERRTRREFDTASGKKGRR
jgi:beta-glucosidase